MLLFNQDVFDDIIDGTSLTWYTSVEYNELLGRPDALLLLIYPTVVSGTSPTLTVAHDQSNDNQHWFQSIAPILNAQALTSNTMLQAWQVQSTGTPSFAFGRLRFYLGGTSPQCQIRMTAIGRSW